MAYSEIDEGRSPVLDIGYGEASSWTQIRVRKTYRNTLRELGKLKPLVIGGVPEPRGINKMIEYMVDEASKSLVHRDMGEHYTHSADPYCGCGPSWPKKSETVIIEEDESDE